MNKTTYAIEDENGLGDAYSRLNGSSIDRGSIPSDRQWQLVVKYCYEKLNDEISTIVHSGKE